MKTLLELDGVAARYGPVQALYNVSLVVREGEIVAVLGANGAGKTTTLRAISGTVSRSGVIELDGKQLKGGPEAAARTGIAHVPEGRGTFVDLTVTENLRLGAYARRRDRSVKEDIKRIAEYFPWMTERGGQRAGTLSGGEQQMLALGRALMKAARSLNDLKNPFLLPGIAVKTGRGDNFPVQQGQLQRWTKGRWVPIGGLWLSKRN